MEVGLWEGRWVSRSSRCLWTWAKLVGWLSVAEPVDSLNQTLMSVSVNLGSKVISKWCDLTCLFFPLTCRRKSHKTEKISTRCLEVLLGLDELGRHPLHTEPDRAPGVQLNGDGGRWGDSHDSASDAPATPAPLRTPVPGLLVVQQLRICLAMHYNRGDMGSISGQGTKIPQTTE